MANLGSITVGDEIKVYLKTGDEFRGIIFAFDKRNDTLVLEETEEKDSKVKHTRILRISNISGTETLRTTPSTKMEKIPLIDNETVRRNENVGLEAAAREHAKIGKDVPPEAQLLFDQLAKTYSIQWNGKIIESKQLQLSISPPYGPEDCKGTDPISLERIKQVVKSIREKANSPAKTVS